MNQNLIARFNIQVEHSIPPDKMAALQNVLYDAAVWAGEDDPEVFFVEKTNVLGVGVSVEDDRLSLLEAGAVLGQCQLAYQKFGGSAGPTWLSIHAADESLIDTPYEP